MTKLRPDLSIISREIPATSRILDIGCGDGALLSVLRDEKQCKARGIEIDGSNVSAAVARGLSVIQGDADIDLSEYPDKSFDYTILSQTLQTTKRPDLVLDDLLRIGGQAFVSFPNFAYWPIRFAHMFGGRMPVTKQIPYTWYNTPNIHHVTIDDFRGLLKEKNIEIVGSWFLTGNQQTTRPLANLLAAHAVFQLRKSE